MDPSGADRMYKYIPRFQSQEIFNNYSPETKNPPEGPTRCLHFFKQPRVVGVSLRVEWVFAFSNTSENRKLVALLSEFESISTSSKAHF
jgi:hypothetical protein